MADICVWSQSVSTGSGTKKTTTLHKFYIDYSITDYPDRVVISSNACIYAKLESAIAGRNAVTEIGNTTSGWYVNGNQYLLPFASDVSVDQVGVEKSKVIASAQTTVYKTHVAQNISVTAAVLVSCTCGSTKRRYTISPSGTIPVGAKTSYAVTYNANGGLPTPDSQTKWYGEDLTLSTSVPYKEGFTFGGWTASNGTVYQPGDTYSANEETTLTAIWVEAGPKIKVKVNGEWEEGELKAKVNGEWVDAEAAYVKVDGAWIEIN